MSESNKKTFSSIVDSDSFHKLKLHCLQNNIPLNKWLQDVIDSTVSNPLAKTETDELPGLDSRYLDKKNWLMSNLENTDAIGTIKAGAEEWSLLIRQWNRGDLQHEKLKALAQ